MKEIIINSKTYGKKIVLVDDEDYEEILKHRWHVYRTVERFYTKCRINKKQVKMHRFVMEVLYHHIIPKGCMIDHIKIGSESGLDNRKENLRIVTNSENQLNRGVRKNGLSKYKGVTFNRNKNKWYSCCTVKGEYHFFGYFDKEIDAAKKYNEEIKKYHGEYAYTNLIDENDN